MSDTPRPINITQSKVSWHKWGLCVLLDIRPGKNTVLQISREEAAIFRDELNRYLGETNEH